MAFILLFICLLLCALLARVYLLFLRLSKKDDLRSTRVRQIIDDFSERISPHDREMTKKVSTNDGLDALAEILKYFEYKSNALAHAIVKQNLDHEFTIEQRTRSLSEKTRQLEVTNRIISEQQKVLLDASKLTALGQMAGSVAHEINNPLSILVGRLDQILSALKKDDFSTEKVLSWVNACKKQCDRITNIVRGMRIISHRDERPDFESHNIVRVIKETISICEDTLRKKEIEVVEEYEEECILIECSQTLISQVLLNLLNNAVDALDSKEGIRIIELNVKANNNQVQLDIKDNGKGIPISIQSKIFDPFYTTKEVGQGTGLGLSICLGIVKKHFGSLVLIPSKEGAHFRIQLPLKQAMIKAS